VRDVDVDVDSGMIDGEEVNAVGTLTVGADDESKKTLRDQLRKTLANKTSTPSRSQSVYPERF
jgi:hypothetical protein